MSWTMTLDEYKATGLRISRLEGMVGKLALQIEQFMRIGLADADNSFYCSEIDEEAECRKWDGVFGPLVK